MSIRELILVDFEFLLLFFHKKNYFLLLISAKVVLLGFIRFFHDLRIFIILLNL